MSENKHNRRKSDVWTMYTRLNGEQVMCDICNTKLSSSSVTNLRKHLIAQHINHPEIPDSIKSSLERFPRTYGKCGGRKRKISVDSNEDGTEDASDNHITRSAALSDEDYVPPPPPITRIRSNEVVKTTTNKEFMKACATALGRNYVHKEQHEYEAVGVSIGAKLKRMDATQAIFAEQLISKVIARGLLNTLNENVDLSENVYVLHPGPTPPQ